MEGRKMTLRLIAMGLLVVLFALTAGGRLLGLQILSELPAAAQRQERTFRHTVTLPAARGEILDRYGRPLVTNRFVYGITIDRGFLHSGGVPAETIMSLVRRARKLELDYTDTFPVTAYPYRFTEMDNTVRAQLGHYLEKMEWHPEISAPELMELIYLDYGIAELDEDTGAFRFLYNWSAEERRMVVGVMYEVEMRHRAAMAEQRLGQTYFFVPPYIFAEDIPVSLLAYISENRLRGPQLVPRNVREYQTSAAAHLLGRIGPIFPEYAEHFRALGYSMDEKVGIDGAEKAFEPWLHGVAGRETVTTDENGHIIDKSVTPPQAGSNVYLTLDIRLQAEVEQLLEAGVRRLQETGGPREGREAEAAAAVVLDARTSEVLAAANYPTFNLATFNEDFADLLEDPLRPMFNRAVSGTYHPGSAFKMVTGAGALQNGIITPEAGVHCGGVYRFFQDFQPSCHRRSGHGNLNARRAMQVSCNIYYFDVGRRLGISELNRWARLFGLGEPAGIEIDGDNPGVMSGPETSERLGTSWFDGMTLSAAIGQQDNAFTPLQLANYGATIANGGTLHRAHLLREVVSFDNARVYHFTVPERIHSLNLYPQNLAAIQEGMLMAAQPGGTAGGVFADFHIPVAGKTGTAQRGGRPPNGVFVAYAPYENPQIAVAVVVESGGGGSRVAPIARDIIDVWSRLQTDLSGIIPENSLKR